MMRIGVLVSGRGTNLQAIIDACEDGRVPGKVVVVISNNPDAYALTRARNHKIPAFAFSPDTPDLEEQAIQKLKEFGVDLVCLAGFMKVLSGQFLSEFPQRVMNIHPAILPAFRGLEAQRRAWERGVKIAGCTVHFVDEKVDHGPIILQAAVPVLESDTLETLTERILQEEHRIYPEAIRLFAENRLKVEEGKVKIQGAL